MSQPQWRLYVPLVTPRGSSRERERERAREEGVEGEEGGGHHSNAREESACCHFSFPSPGRPGRDGHETGVRGAGQGFKL